MIRASEQVPTRGQTRRSNKKGFNREEETPSNVFREMRTEESLPKKGIKKIQILREGTETIVRNSQKPIIPRNRQPTALDAHPTKPMALCVVALQRLVETLGLETKHKL